LSFLAVSAIVLPTTYYMAIHAEDANDARREAEFKKMFASDGDDSARTGLRGFTTPASQVSAPRKNGKKVSLGCRVGAGHFHQQWAAGCRHVTWRYGVHRNTRHPHHRHTYNALNSLA